MNKMLRRGLKEAPEDLQRNHFLNQIKLNLYFIYYTFLTDFARQPKFRLLCTNQSETCNITIDPFDLIVKLKQPLLLAKINHGLILANTKFDFILNVNQTLFREPKNLKPTELR